VVFVLICTSSGVVCSVRGANLMDGDRERERVDRENGDWEGICMSL
jgi:hypothetical protein